MNFYAIALEAIRRGGIYRYATPRTSSSSVCLPRKAGRPECCVIRFGFVGHG